MSEARKVLLNTGFQIFGKLINAFLALLTVRILTNTLDQGQYGGYITLFEFMGFFGIAADFGLFTIAVREMSANPENKKKIFGNILGMRIVLIALLCLLAGIIGGIVFHEKNYMQFGIWIVSITTVFTLLSGTLTSLLQVNLKMGKATISSVFSKVISVALIYYYSLGFEGIETFYNYLWAGAWGALGMLILTIIFAMRLMKFQPLFEKDYWIETMRRSLPYGAALILTQVYFKIDIQMIFFLRSDAEAGIYGISVRIIEALAIFAIFFMNSVMPVLSPAVRKNKEKAKKIVQYAFDFLFLIGVPMAFGVFAVSRDIIALIGNADYLSKPGFWGSDWTLNLLVLAMFFGYLGIVFEFFLVSLGRQKILLTINFLGVATNLILNFILIPKYGIIAAAGTSIVSEFLIMLLKISFVKKYFPDFKLSVLNAEKMMFSALIMSISAFYLVNNFGFIICIIGSSVIYFSLIFILGAIDREFLKKILAKEV